MYYLVYGFFYLISLLPFFILYGISDIIFVFVYYVFGYRKKIVMGNLAIAFPGKSLTERKTIARKFYSAFIDTFFESIKLLSISDKALEKRCSVDIDVPNKLAAEGKNIYFCCGHQMNWEYANRMFAKKINIPWVVVYMTVKNKAINRLFFKLRSGNRAVLLSTKEFRSRMHEIMRSQYSLALAADQNPGILNNAWWLYFFGRKTPFITGPGKGAVKNNASVFFMKFKRIKRGHYHFETKLITENAGGTDPARITLLYRDFLEATIKEDPFNYLWSHRRWKYTFNENNEIFQRNWIEERSERIS